MAEAALALALTRFVDRLRPSPRERALVAVLAAALTSAWAVAAFDQALTSRDASAEARAVGLTLQQAAEARGAASFRAAVAAEARKARAWSLAGPTLAIARVRAESALLGMARAAGVAEARIVPTPAPSPTEGAVQVVPVTLEGDFDWLSFLTLLSLVAEAEQSAVPRSVEVGEAEAEGDASRPARFRLAVLFPYVPAEAGA